MHSFMVARYELGKDNPTAMKASISMRSVYYIKKSKQGFQRDKN
jgi:hypothetical protein